jgi:hypothetical protein
MENMHAFARAGADIVITYHAREIPGMAATYANPPVAVKEDLGAVMDAIRGKFASMR